MRKQESRIGRTNYHHYVILVPQYYWHAKNFICYYLNIFWISSMVFPLVSGTNTNVKTPPRKQMTPYIQNVPLAPSKKKKISSKSNLIFM